MLTNVTDMQFEARVNVVIPAAVRVNAFYARIAATSHTDANGTSHATIIEKCKTFDVLRLEKNPFAPDSVAVFTEAGEQIGCLDSRLANGTMVNTRWIAVFRNKNRHSETGAVSGAIVYLIHLTEQYARNRSRTITREQVAGRLA